MKQTQVIATRPYGHWFPIVSWMIRLFQWSSHSHVVLYFPDQKIMRHAYFNEIKEQDPDSFFEDNRLVDIRTITISDEQYQKIDEYSKSKVGKQTGYWSTLVGSIPASIIRTLFKTKLKNPWYKGLTCSEFVRNSLRQVDEVLVFVLTNDLPEGTFNTEDALKLASEISK